MNKANRFWWELTKCAIEQGFAKLKKSKNCDIILWYYEPYLRISELWLRAGGKERRVLATC